MVDDRQKELNLAAAKIIKTKCDEKKVKLEGYKKLKKR